MFENEQELINMIPREWREICGEEIFKDFFWKNIVNTLNSSEYYPSKNDLFKALDLVKPDDVKVVIIGQDPYISPNQAMGLSFSVKNGINIPPSLRNIYKELFQEFYEAGATEEIQQRTEKRFLEKYKKHGDLSKWCSEGVLLLNTILSVKPHESRSHINVGWEHFTSHLISSLDSSKTVIFIALGKDAYKVLYDNVKYNDILYVGHPSPLNYSNPFLGCNCFTRCNKMLEERCIDPINWIVVFDLP